MSDYAKQRLAEMMALPPRMGTVAIQPPPTPKKEKKSGLYTMDWWRQKRQPKKRDFTARRGLKIGAVEEKRPYTAAREPHQNNGHATVAALGAKVYARPYKNCLNTGTCTYCGVISDTKDHVIPVVFGGRTGTRRGKAPNVYFTVDCCRECNSFLGSKLIPNVVDRASYLFRTWKVRKRYSWDRLAYLEKVAMSEES